MSHNIATKKAIQSIKELDGISKILLYGSVATGIANSKSDIDIAIILNDLMRFMPPDPGGLPLNYQEKINNIVEEIKNTSNLRLHIVTYWKSEFEKGIKLETTKNRPINLLNKVTITKFNLDYL